MIPPFNPSLWTALGDGMTLTDYLELSRSDLITKTISMTSNGKVKTCAFMELVSAPSHNNNADAGPPQFGAEIFSISLRSLTIIEVGVSWMWGDRDDASLDMYTAWVHEREE